MALAARPICGTSERWEVVSATQITRSADLRDHAELPPDHAI